MKQAAISLTVLFIITMVACKKNETNTVADSTSIQEAVTELQAVSVGVSNRKAGDSVYVINTCRSNEKLDSIAFTSLPEVAVNYLATNYEDYTEVKALSIKDNTGTISGYIAVIKIDDSPIGIKFDAGGNFVKVLEQKEGRDLKDRWHHQGAPGKGQAGKDTIAISALPVAITSYMNSNYASDTLLYAFIKKNNDYVIVSKNQGIYATTFSSNGDFISHDVIKEHKGRLTIVVDSNLPSTITSYLESKYPGYSIDKSFSLASGQTIIGYLLLIEASGTKYGLSFDAAGNFLAVKLVK